ncbi:adenylosuccinate lyase [Myxococcota bacterium]|nr:adenylosuccinate lyase [Myxococcota bacterium]
MLERYLTPEMERIWAPKNRYDQWLRVELAACRAMEERGIVPVGTADSVAPLVTIDPRRIDEIEAITRHDVIAFLTHVEEQAGEPARWLHLGLTSSDILDSSFAILLTDAMSLILQEAENLSSALREMTLKHRKTAMIGRTHGIHAEPTSLGLTFALWYAEMRRNITRLAQAKKIISVGKIAGAVGNYGNLSPEIEARALEQLGLTPEVVATQVVQRDRHAEYFTALAITAGTIEKMAITIRHWQRTEVNEAAEPFGKGQKGSSAMPHKRNPILCENITGLARTVRGYVAPALENMALWHERDISHSSVERVIAPDATSLTQFMLRRMTTVISGLDVFEDRMEEHIHLTGGLVLSESVLLEVIRKGVPRQKAYEAVQRCAMASRSGSDTFFQLLTEDPLIREKLTPQEIATAMDVEHHLRHVDQIIERALNT